MASSKERKKRKQFAEKHGDFIISRMKELGDKYAKFGPAEQIKKGIGFTDKPKLKGGLLMFYLVPRRNKEKKIKLPIYVGQTTREFSSRLKDKDLEHIYELFYHQGYHIYAVACRLTNPQASFMKEVFLDVFNFFGNRSRSDFKRTHLDYDVIYSKEKTWEMVKKKWSDIKENMNDVFDKVEDISEKNLKEFAEKHGDFIISRIKELDDKYAKFGPVEKIRDIFRITDELELKGGLLIIYFVPRENKTKKSKNIKLPIYVGQTTRELSSLLEDLDLEHIYELFDHHKYHLYAVECRLTNPQASFMKEVFLDVFNFIGNRLRSDYNRTNLDYDDIYSREESWEMVKGKWRGIKKDMNDVFDKVQDISRVKTIFHDS